MGCRLQLDFGASASLTDVDVFDLLNEASEDEAPDSGVVALLKPLRSLFTTKSDIIYVVVAVFVGRGLAIKSNLDVSLQCTCPHTRLSRDSRV